jgi:sugar lactone lactonase YvrE
LSADGSAREVGYDLRMANGMVITSDLSTLLVAERWGKRITAFDLAENGGLGNQWVWAELPEYPDGIGIDTEDGVCVASPVSDRFVRVGLSRRDDTRVDRISRPFRGPGRYRPNSPRPRE